MSDDRLINTLAMIDETYAGIPSDLVFQIDEITRFLRDMGPRKLPQKGTGMDYYDARPYRQGDDARKISFSLSYRMNKKMVVEVQDETRQPVFIWRKGYGTTTIEYPPPPKRLTKKEYLDVSFLAVAKALAYADDKVGILDGQGLYSGGAAGGYIAAQFLGVNIITGNVPLIGRKIPVGSTVILGSDFFAKPEDQGDIANAIGHLASMGANGHICMVIDPLELHFDKFKGHLRFHGKEGERVYISKKAEAVRDEYNKKMRGHIDWVRDLANSNGFKFILQRVDTKPLDMVLRLYGLNTGNPALEPPTPL